jgi:hypothetical protein
MSLRKGTPMSLAMADTLVEQVPDHDAERLRDAVRGIMAVVLRHMDSIDMVAFMIDMTNLKPSEIREALQASRNKDGGDGD